MQMYHRCNHCASVHWNPLISSSTATGACLLGLRKPLQPPKVVAFVPGPRDPPTLSLIWALSVGTWKVAWVSHGFTMPGSAPTSGPAAQRPAHFVCVNPHTNQNHASGCFPFGAAHQVGLFPRTTLHTQAAPERPKNVAQSSTAKP